MAELTPEPARDAAVEARTTERELRARVAELEALLDARTQTIVGLGARLAELEGTAPPSTSVRLRAAEDELARLRATKVMRWSQVPRRVYAQLRGIGRG